jgi:bacteriorhodopsin
MKLGVCILLGSLIFVCANHPLGEQSLSGSARQPHSLLRTTSLAAGHTAKGHEQAKGNATEKHDHDHGQAHKHAEHPAKREGHHKHEDHDEKGVIGHTGRTFLWVSFFALLLPTIYFFISMWSQERKYFHAITTYITGCASLAYLVMAAGSGFVMVGDHQFFYVRYIDWAITTPLLLLDLLGICNASFDLTFAVIGADILMVVAGLGGALFTSSVKWGFWAFGMLMFCPIVFYLATGLTRSAEEVGHNAAELFSRLGWLTVISWAFYPLMWILAEGLGSISVDVEVVGYGLLDITAKSVFGLMLIFSREAVDEALQKRARLSLN